MENLRTFRQVLNEARKEPEYLQLGSDGMYHPKNNIELSYLLDKLIDERGNEGDFNDIDTSEVDDMSNVFNVLFKNPLKSPYKFNGDISKWNTSNVTSMINMFYGCQKFNCDISNWDVSKVVSMEGMFENANSFNQDISKWDVRNVKAYDMFDMGCNINKKFKPKFV